MDGAGRDEAAGERGAGGSEDSSREIARRTCDTVRAAAGAARVALVVIEGRRASLLAVSGAPEVPSATPLARALEALAREAVLRDEEVRAEDCLRTAGGAARLFGASALPIRAGDAAGGSRGDAGVAIGALVVEGGGRAGFTPGAMEALRVQLDLAAAPLARALSRERSVFQRMRAAFRAALASRPWRREASRNGTRSKTSNAGT